MYVCLCNGITDRDIQRVLNTGTRRKRDIFDQLGANMSCAKCAGEVGRMIDRHVDQAGGSPLIAAE